MPRKRLCTIYLHLSLQVDEKGTWTFPTLTKPRKFTLRGLEVDVTNLCVGKVKRGDQRTWTEENGWELDEEGMIGLPPFWTKQFMENRQREKSYRYDSTKFLSAAEFALKLSFDFDGLVRNRAACNIIGSHDLIISIDRGAIFRPMQSDVLSQSKEAAEEWPTARNVHLDMDPWGYFGISKQADEQRDPVCDKSALQASVVPPKQNTGYTWEGDFMREHNETIGSSSPQENAIPSS